MSYGGGFAQFIARNLDVSLAIAPEGPGPTVQVQVQVRARALWRVGLSQCVAMVDAAVRALTGGGAATERYVQRIDLCVDFQGWKPELADLERFVSAGRSTMGPFAHDAEPGTREWRSSMGGDETGLDRQAWYRCKLTGFRIGRGAGEIIARLYDKTAEIYHSQKFWFRDVWRQAEGYEAGAPVWRLELQYRRGALVKIHGPDARPLETVEDVTGALSELWQYGTTDWLRLTLGDNERLTRATTHPAWEQLAAVPMYGVESAGKITRVHLWKADRAALVPGMAGYAASFAALAGRATLAETLSDQANDIAEYCTARGETFEDLVKRKAERFETSERVRAALEVRAQEARRVRERQLQEAEEAIRKRAEQLGEDAQADLWFAQEQASAMS